ncbi:hypothetical protein ACOSP7_013858 [Xanthoceras sorbifolium]
MLSIALASFCYSIKSSVAYFFNNSIFFFSSTIFSIPFSSSSPSPSPSSSPPPPRPPPPRTKPIELYKLSRLLFLLCFECDKPIEHGLGFLFVSSHGYDSQGKKKKKKKP